MRIRNGVETTFPPELADIDVMAITGPVFGWVRPGDFIAVRMTLSAAVDVSGQVQLSIWEDARITGRPGRSETVWMDSVVHGNGVYASSTMDLEAGVAYRIVVEGNYRHHETADVYDEGDPDDILFPSDSPGSSGKAGLDYETVYAWRDSTYALPDHWNDLDPARAIRIDLGSGPSHVEPVGGPYSSPAPEHRYELRVVGEGAPFKVTAESSDKSDNNGQLRFDIHRES